VLRGVERIRERREDGNAFANREPLVPGPQYFSKLVGIAFEVIGNVAIVREGAQSSHAEPVRQRVQIVEASEQERPIGVGVNALPTRVEYRPKSSSHTSFYLRAAC
jgi:hypothetical protein